MRVYTERTLRNFWRRHADAEGALDGWYRETRQAHWQTPAEVRARYANASFVGNNRVVFNIKGNAYRLVAYIDYRKSEVHIRFIGTHAEYDRINALEV